MLDLHSPLSTVTQLPEIRREQLRNCDAEPTVVVQCSNARRSMGTATAEDASQTLENAMHSETRHELPWSEHRWLLTVAAIAIAAGLYGRFTGLGVWALGVDEFFISRSIDNILRSGLPEYLCGGYYTRGLVYQYSVALMRLIGMSAESSGRLLSAASSLLVLPAAYLIGRRVHGRTVGLLAIAILSVSIWEIEMARFERMYAPFQAIFAWYLVCFMRYVLDDDRRAAWWMAALSVLGALTWEGGAIIGLVNLLPPILKQKNGRLSASDWRYLAAMTLLFVVLYVFNTTNWRMYSSIPALPDNYTPPAGPDKTTAIQIIWTALSARPLLALAAAIPVILMLPAVRWIWRFRNRWLAALGLTLALLSALAHQLLLCASVLLLLCLTRLVDWRELLDGAARWFHFTLLAAAIFWLIFGVITGIWPGGTLLPGKLPGTIVALFEFPDVVGQVAHPWAGVMLLWTVSIFIATAALIAYVLHTKQQFSPVGVLLVVIVTLLLTVGATDTPRIETRYTYFLYPIAVIFLLTAVALLAHKLTSYPRAASFLTSALGLFLFGVTEDFRPVHLVGIASEKINFRIGMSSAQAAHYYPRNDVKRTAAWLHQHVREDDIVMTGIPNLHQYYPQLNSVFLDDTDETYVQYACNRGTVDRWTGLPLVYTLDALEAQLAVNHRIFLVVYPQVVETIESAATRRGWQYEGPLKTGGGVVMILQNPPPTQSRAVTNSFKQTER